MTKRLLLPLRAWKLSGGKPERRAAMKYYVGLDMGHKRTSVCVIDDEGTLVWQGEVDTHPEMIVSAVSRWANDLALV
jgi:predicted NBD/HSP70 family sugar kinase